MMTRKMDDLTLQSWVEKMPKAENHVHLEGCISPEIFKRLARRNRLDVPFESVQEIKEYVRDNTHSLDAFINTSSLMSSALVKPIDFYDLLVDVADKSYEDHIIYREVMVSFALHEEKGINLQKMVEALADAVLTVKKQYGLELRFIAELDRAKDAAYAQRFVRRMKEFSKQLSIVALGWELGLEGNEADNYTAKEHEKAFALARELGFHTTAHCGEAQGPASVWDVLEHLKVERLDHGVQSGQDPKLLQVLKETHTMCCVCASSNVLLGIYPNLEKHPIRTLLEAQVAVSINTDDPAYLATTLSEEFIRLARAYAWPPTMVAKLARQSFVGSFAGSHLLPIFDDYVKDTLGHMVK